MAVLLTRHAIGERRRMIASCFLHLNHISEQREQQDTQHSKNDGEYHDAPLIITALLLST